MPFEKMAGSGDVGLIVDRHEPSGLNSHLDSHHVMRGRGTKSMALQPCLFKKRAGQGREITFRKKIDFSLVVSGNSFLHGANEDWPSWRYKCRRPWAF